MNHLFNSSRTACLAIVTAFILSGCDRSVEYWMNSYIQVYVEIDGLHICQYGPGAFCFISGNGRTATFKDSGESKDWFDKVCSLNRDVNYNRTVHLPAGMPHIMAFTPNIVSIDVICNDFYDSEHLTGASLNDCVQISYTSAGEYIKNNYEGSDPISIKKRLSEVRQEDLAVLLIVPECKLDFKIRPENLTQHSITIKMKMTDGQEYTDKFIYDFSSNKIVSERHS